MSETPQNQATLFGHPVGLFTLFFAEMWERFSYYGMRALLLFYMLKGFLGLNDHDAYGVYGAYTALVYATPFIGGILADRLLGARRAVILGGILMAAGHLLMTVEIAWCFFTALALLIVGNGFFKPNISTMVGSLYPQGSGKRDAGFTLFYMGINLGAAMSPLLCGYVGETYGWHYGFGLATGGMLVGLAIFVAPVWLTQALIALGALGTAGALLVFQNNPYQLAVNTIVAIALVIAGAIGCTALARGGIPDTVGHPADPEKASKQQWLVYGAVLIAIPLIALLVQRNQLAGILLLVFGGIAFLWLLFQAFQRDKVARERLFVVLILMFFSMMFWAFFEQAGSSINNFTDRNVDRVLETGHIQASQVGETLNLQINQEQLGYSVALGPDELRRVAEPLLTNLPIEKLIGLAELELLGLPRDPDPETIKAMARDSLEMSDEQIKEAGNDKLLSQLARTKLGLSEEQFDDLTKEALLDRMLRQLHGDWLPEGLSKEELKARVAELGVPTDELGELSEDELWLRLAHVPLGLTTTQLDELSPEQLTSLARTQLGWRFEGGRLVMTINVLDGLRSARLDTLPWTVTEDQVGMATGGAEVPASLFQAANPIFILLFAPLFSWLWTRLGTAGKEPSTPVKFALGVLQLGLGFVALYYGATTASDRGMVFLLWLLLGYLLHTTGELCLSPVGLSMVTKLSPADIVSTVMGAWFLATAFSNYLAGAIAKLTGVSHGEGGEAAIPVPSETVNVYGDVFGTIGLTAIVVALLCFVISPLLVRWMHRDLDDTVSE